MLDKVSRDNLISPYTSLWEQCANANTNDPNFIELKKCWDRLNEITNTAANIEEWQNYIYSERILEKFGEYYTAVIMNNLTTPKNQYNNEIDYFSEEYDKKLLNQSLQALENALTEIDRSIKEAQISIINQNQDTDIGKAILRVFNTDMLKLTSTKKAISKLIQIGKNAETYPGFLFEQMELGLDKAMQGIAIVEEVYTDELTVNELQNHSPLLISKSREKVDMFKKHKYNATMAEPIPLDVELDSFKIDVAYETKIRKWDDIQSKWERIISDLATWAAAYTPRAMYVFPWVDIELSKRPAAIEFSKNTLPGLIKVQLLQLNEAYKLSFNDIFHHPTFEHAANNSKLHYSQEYIEHLLLAVWPQCKPLKHLSSDVVSKDQQFYELKKIENPILDPGILKYLKWFGDKYGTETVKQLHNVDLNNPISLTTPRSLAKEWNYYVFIKNIKPIFN